MPRELLYERINQRVLNMVEVGLEKEAKELLPHFSLNALQTVGYREWEPYFSGNSNLASVIALIQQNTRHYAKRQMTWFKKDAEIQWVASDNLAAAHIIP
jgi:tRNA dimethylallyltransferase